MFPNHFINLIIIIFSIFLNVSNYAAITLTGNIKNNNKTFNFPIGPFDFRQGFDQFILYIGSNESKKGDFAVSRIDRNALKFQPITPQITKLNNKAIINSPLFGAKISLLKIFQGLPVVVKDNDKKIYLINGFEKNASILATHDLNDSNGEQTAQIIQLGVANFSSIFTSFIFAAVKNKNNEPFGSDGSGIAVVKIKNKTILKHENGKSVQGTIQELTFIDANEQEVTPKKIDPKKYKKSNNKKHIITTMLMVSNNSNKKKANIPKAVPFNGSINAIKINNNATITSDIVDMHWDGLFSKLYIAFSVRSNNNIGSGARAIVMASMQNGKLNFYPIAPDSVFEGNNKIVGTGNANDNVSIYKVRTLHTSTMLPYLIIAGGNGEISDVANNVYALPLVKNKNESNSKDTTLNGTLAKFNQEPETIYRNNFFSNRLFTQPAEKAHDVLTSNDIAAKVGGGPVPLQSGQLITDIFVMIDNVFVCIGDKYSNNTQPGIFYSAAILDSTGRIQSWSKWQRIATDQKVFGAQIDPIRSEFWFLTGKSKNAINTIKKTVWKKDAKNKSGDGILNGTSENKDVGLVNILNENFPSKIGGIQAFFDFSAQTNGFNNFSMMIATGLKKITLIESGSLKNGFYKPTKGNFSANSVYLKNGVFADINSKTKLISISGGALSEIDVINAAEIATNNNKHWIFVAGIGGLAVLMDQDGNGWFNDITSFNEIPKNLKFKKIGNYSFVKKIKTDGNFLYVLTNKTFDRIRLNNQDFKFNNLEITTLADIKNLQMTSNGEFNDFGISNKFALLATTQGLFRVGNNRNINLANSVTDVNWTKVKVPESVGVISNLLFTTTSNNELDFATKGQVYVLNSYRGLHQTRINRFFINLTGEINNSTLQPLPDLIVKNQLGNFFDFGDFKDNFSQNFSLNFNSSSKDGNINTSFQIIPGIKTASRVLTTKSFDIGQLSNDDTQIGPVLLNSASGSLLVAHDTGLQVNE